MPANTASSFRRKSSWSWRTPDRPTRSTWATGKWIVIGRGFGGRLIQVIYIIDRDGTIYVIHARLLTDREKRRYRRRVR
jgi:uncharacterized DUF497 family protein